MEKSTQHMFERFTEKNRRVIFFARYEASVFGTPFIEAEHLLLGLLREDRGVFLRLLTQAPSYNDINAKVGALAPRTESKSTSVDLPLSMDAKRCIVYAAEEASRLAHQNIGTEHLLLGLLRDDLGMARRLLGESKSLDEIRAVLKANPPETRSTQALTSTSVPMALNVKRAIALAAEEARQAGVREIETEHLLLGLLQDQESRAASILNQQGVTLALIRKALQHPGQH